MEQGKDLGPGNMLDVDSLKADAGDPAVGPDLRGEVEFGEIEDAPRSFGSLNAGEFKKLIGRCGELFSRSNDQTAAIVALEYYVKADQLTIKPDKLVSAALLRAKDMVENQKKIGS